MSRCEVYNKHLNVIPVVEPINQNPLVITIKEEPTETIETPPPPPPPPQDNNNDESVVNNPVENADNENQSTPLVDENQVLPQNEIQTNDDGTKKPATPKERSRISNRELESLVINNGLNTNELKVSRRSNETPAQITYECDICSTICPSKLSLSVHKFRHDKQKYICYICRYNCDSAASWLDHQKKKHIKTFLNIRKKVRYHCDKCPIYYCKKELLDQHVHHEHNDKGNQLEKKSKNQSTTPAKSNDTTTTNTRDKETSTKRKADETGQEKRGIKKRKNHHYHWTKRRSKRTAESASIQGDANSDATVLPNERDTESPLVQIHGIPQEVEALLSDSVSTTKKRRLNIQSPNDSPSAASSSQESYNRKNNPIIYGLLSKPTLNSNINNQEVQQSAALEPLKTSQSNEENIKSSSSSSSSSTRRNLLQRAAPLSVKKLRLIRQNTNCRDCHVKLDRIDLDAQRKIKSIELSNGFDGYQRPIGLELKNLDLALKQLSDSGKFNEEFNGEIVDNNYENSSSPLLASKEVTSTTNQKTIYRSSACRSRFTTKRKLIYHYLCFHTNSSDKECGVCHIKCKDLKKHLSLHCIKIGLSKQDHSPIDKKGPCETYKKKFVCNGCKKRFWLSSCMKKHVQHCRFVKAKIANEKKKDKAKIKKKIINENSIEDIPDNLNNDNDDDKIIESPRTSTRSSRRLSEKLKLTETDKKSTCKNEDGIESIDTCKIDENNKTLSFELIPSPYRDTKDKDLLKCSVCNCQFLTLETLADHKRKWSQINGPEQCKDCGIIFPNLGLRRAHKKSTHGQDAGLLQYLCEICNQGFSSKRNKRSHLFHIHYNELNGNALNDYNKLKKRCNCCNVVFKKYKCFVEHSMYYNDDELFNCEKCNMKFYGKHRIHSHNKLVHYTKLVQDSYTHYCYICQEGFMYQVHLESHLSHAHNQSYNHKLNKDSSKSLTCKICEEKFATQALILQHKNEHLNEGIFKCSYCDRKCRTQTSLNDHNYLTHCDDDMTKRIKCLLCPENLKSIKSWISHIKHHHLDQKFSSSYFFLEKNSEPIMDLMLGIEQTNSERDPLEINNKKSTNSVEPELLADDNISVSQFSDNAEIGEMLWDTEIDDEIPHSDIEYTCAICDENFTTKSELTIHRKRHSTDEFVYEKKDNDEKLASPRADEIVDSLKDSAAETQALTYNPTENTENVVPYNNAIDDSTTPMFISNIRTVELSAYENLTNLESVCQSNDLTSQQVFNQPQQVQPQEQREEEEEQQQQLQQQEQLKQQKEREQQQQKQQQKEQQQQQQQQSTPVPHKTCPDCLAPFSCLKSLTNHLAKYANTGTYSCEYCQRKFMHGKAYREHKLKHENRKKGNTFFRHYCEKCDEIFASAVSKRMHFAHIHKVLIQQSSTENLRNNIQPYDENSSDSLIINPTSQTFNVVNDIPPPPPPSSSSLPSSPLVSIATPINTSTPATNLGQRCPIQEVDLTTEDDETDDQAKIQQLPLPILPSPGPSSSPLIQPVPLSSLLPQTSPLTSSPLLTTTPPAAISSPILPSHMSQSMNIPQSSISTEQNTCLPTFSQSQLPSYSSSMTSATCPTSPSMHTAISNLLALSSPHPPASPTSSSSSSATISASSTTISVPSTPPLITIDDNDRTLDFGESQSQIFSNNSPYVQSLVCSICGQISETVEILLKHLEDSHKLCPPARSTVVPTRRINIDDNSIESRNINSLLSTDCKIYLDEKSGLMIAQTNKPQQITKIYKLFTCKVCNVKFANDQSLAVHFNNAHGKFVSEKKNNGTNGKGGSLGMKNNGLTALEKSNNSESLKFLGASCAVVASGELNSTGLSKSLVLDVDKNESKVNNDDDKNNSTVNCDDTNGAKVDNNDNDDDKDKSTVDDNDDKNKTTINDSKNIVYEKMNCNDKQKKMLHLVPIPASKLLRISSRHCVDDRRK